MTCDCDLNKKFGRIIRENDQVKGNNSSSKDRLCIRIGLTESSNMLHYSNASSIEKNRRYLVIKGGLAWLLWQERGVGDTVPCRILSGHN